MDVIELDAYAEICKFTNSTWKLTEGGSQLVEALADVIKVAGGAIFMSKKVSNILEQDGRVGEVPMVLFSLQRMLFPPFIPNY